MAGELLESKRFVIERGGKDIHLKAERELGTLAYLARRFVDDLRRAQQRLLDLQRSTRAREDRIAALEAQGSRLAASQGTIASELAEVRRDLERYRKDLAGGLDARRTLVREVAEKREGLVQVVEAMKLASESKSRDELAVRGDEAVDAAIRKFKPARRTARASGGSARTPSPYETYVPAIQSCEVRLVRDRVALWVAATINGSSGRKLVVDPTVETVQISSRFAGEVGLTVPPTAAALTVKLGDGQAVTARRASLASLTVGPFEERDVDCLVLEGYDGPPRLGASFFDRFVTRIDSDAARLSLTQVDLKALSAPAASRPRAMPPAH
jgi:predicted aspartyl protease